MRPLVLVLVLVGCSQPSADADGGTLDGVVYDDGTQRPQCVGASSTPTCPAGYSLICPNGMGDPRWALVRVDFMYECLLSGATLGSGVCDAVAGPVCPGQSPHPWPLRPWCLPNDPRCP